MRLPATNFKFQIKNYKFKNGFTLIELLVVIFIIGILATLVFSSYSKAQMKARDGKRKVDLKAAQQALDSYLQANGVVPLSFAGQIRCGVTGDLSVHVWGTTFVCGVAPNQITYMNTLPVDPATPTYGYNYTRLSALSYRINAVLENTNDPDYCNPSTTDCIATGKLPCQPSSGYFYCVINP